MGRPNKFTPQMREEICKRLAIGLPDTVVCDAVGISPMTFYKWIRENDAFATMVKQARASFFEFHTANITHHAGRDWKASAWMLERRGSGRYGHDKPSELVAIDALDDMGVLPPDIRDKVDETIGDVSRKIREAFKGTYGSAIVESDLPDDTDSD